MLKTTTILAVTLLILGGSWTVQGSRAEIRITEQRPLSATTMTTLATDYAMEPKHGTPLDTGLALSGGGPRAGMFAHGVLQGLNDSSVLDNLDAISTVSGGSYAGLWYFTKRLEAKRFGFDYKSIFSDCIPLWWEEGSDKDSTVKLIKIALNSAGKGGDSFKPMNQCQHQWNFKEGDPYRWQVHLSRWPDIFSYTQTIPTGSKQSAPLGEAVKLGIYSVGEILASPLVATGAVPSAYQYGIERAWGLNPNPRKLPSQDFTYTNDTGKPQTFGWHLDSFNVTWKQLRNLYSDSTITNLPLWIVNASNAPRSIKNNEKHIFEMTPFGQGSELTGYLRDQGYVIDSLGKSVRASAAALDGQGAKAKYAPTLSKMNPLFPLAEWGVTVNDKFHGGHGTFRLSDGGHSENLGVYSLLRRGTKDIIIVDATEDRYGRMEDLCLLKHTLSRQDIKLTFDTVLKDLDKVCESTIAKPVAKFYGYDTAAWLNPVIPGKVIWPSDYPTTRVWLIKLGWDKQAVKRAFNAGKCESKAFPVSCMLTAYYGHNSTTTHSGSDEDMYFPHLTTMGSGYNMSTYLFWAYRELGRTAASTLIRQPDGTLALRHGIMLKPQKTVCFTAGKQSVRC